MITCLRNSKLIFLTLFVFMLMPAARSQAFLWDLPKRATERTQLLNLAELLAIAIDTEDTLDENIKQYKDMELNTDWFGYYHKQRLLGDIRRLSQIVKIGQAVAYSSAGIDRAYRQAHQANYAEMRGNKSARNYQTFADKYQKWAQINHDSVKGALRAAGLQARQFYNENELIKNIEHQIDKAEGRNRILKAAASLSGQEITQLGKLRQLLMSQIQIQAAQVGGQVDRQSEEDEDLQRALRPRHGLNPDRSGGINMNTPMRE